MYCQFTQITSSSRVSVAPQVTTVHVSCVCFSLTLQYITVYSDNMYLYSVFNICTFRCIVLKRASTQPTCIILYRSFSDAHKMDFTYVYWLVSITHASLPSFSADQSFVPFLFHYFTSAPSSSDCSLHTLCTERVFCCLWLLSVNSIIYSSISLFVLRSLFFIVTINATRLFRFYKIDFEFDNK